MCLLCLGIEGCRGYTPAPELIATGYIADQGAVRLWRQDDSQQRPRRIVSAYSPYHGRNTVVTHFSYLSGRLSQVREERTDPHSQIQLRFDENGNVSYMQFQQGGRKEPLVDGDVVRFRYESAHLVKLTHTLRVGGVELMQGTWIDGKVHTCIGKLISPVLESRQLAKINQRAKASSIPLSIAWLNGPEGTQLLLVANENFCHWEPKLTDQ